MDGGTANRQIVAGEQAGEGALRHNVGARNANVAARCAAAGTDERGVAAIFRRRDIDHAAVFDNEVDGVDARIQRGRFDLRVVERNRAVASDANAAGALTARLVSRTETLPLPVTLMPSLVSPSTLIARLPGPVISMFPAAIMPMLSSKVMELLP